MDLCTICLCSFSPGAVTETYFLDVVTTQYDHLTHVKPFLGGIYVYFILLGHWRRGWGESPKGLVHNLLMQLFVLGILRIFRNLFFQYHEHTK